MPPIMRIGAFIMAEMHGVPYKTIVFAAIIPAVAYYMSVFLLVTFIANKKSIADAGTEVSAVAIDPILPRLYLLLPAAVLVYFMVSGSSLMRSGMMGIYTALGANLISRFVLGKKHYVKLKKLGIISIQGVKQASEIAIPTGACGIIIGVLHNASIGSVIRFPKEVWTTFL